MLIGVEVRLFFLNHRCKRLNKLLIAASVFLLWRLGFGSMGPLSAAGKLQHPEIKGDDDRLIVEAEEYPWSAIGRVNRAGQGFCTGVLVGPKTVLTAAHCIYNKRTRKNFRADSLHFVSGYQKGAYLAHARATSVQMAPGYVSNGKASLEQSAQDWALLTLAEPLGAVVGYFGVVDLTPKRLADLNRRSTIFVQAGYSKDRQHIISAHVNCELQGYAKEARVVVHLCDAISGDSGSPLFAYIDGSFSIVAIHSATLRDVTRPLGIALPSESFIQALPPVSVKGGRPPWRRSVGQAKSIEQIRGLLALEQGLAKAGSLGEMIQSLPAKRNGTNK